MADDKFNHTKEQHLLFCLIEEAGEVIQDASKILRFGFGDIGPNNKLPNHLNLENEIADLLAVIEMLNDAKIINNMVLRSRIDKKKDKIKHFMGYTPFLVKEEAK